MRRWAAGQGGYTLIEVIITVAISAVVMSALTSVILTTVRAASTASARVEASAQIRGFESFAYDDMVASGVPSALGCTSASSACTTQPLTLAGTQASNSSTPAINPYQVTYTWDGSSFLDRQAGGSAVHVATDVTSFSWYVTSNGARQIVVVSMTVTVNSYSESQTFLFYPRVQ